MSNAELWEAVGRQLGHLRRQRGFTSTIALATHVKKPNIQKTLDRIERGKTGQLRKVYEYCDLLETSLSDVLRAVLPADRISGQAVLIAHAYDAGEPKAQQLVEMALDVPPPAARRDRVPTGPAAAPRAASGDSRGRGRIVQGRK